MCSHSSNMTSQKYTLTGTRYGQGREWIWWDTYLCNIKQKFSNFETRKKNTILSNHITGRGFIAIWHTDTVGVQKMYIWNNHFIMHLSALHVTVTWKHSKPTQLILLSLALKMEYWCCEACNTLFVYDIQHPFMETRNLYFSKLTVNMDIIS